MDLYRRLYPICFGEKPVLVSRFVRRIAPVAFFLLVTLVFTHPLGLRMGSSALDLGPDTRLFLWTLGWDAHALGTAPLSIFDANIFHPEPRTLAYSEHQIGSALFAAPLIWTTGNLVLAMNAVAILSCFLAGGFAYVLGRQLGLSTTSSILVGAIFALSPPRFFRIGQLHLATVQWIPLCLALLHRYARSGTRLHLLGAVVVFWLQALSGGQSAVFLALAAAGLLSWLWIFGELRPAGSVWKDGGAAFALTLALNLPFLLPYLQVRRELGLDRSLDEAIFWSPNAVSYLASPTHVHRAIASVLGLRGEKAYLFPGFVPLALAFLAFLPRERSKRTVSPGSEKTSLTLRALDFTIVTLLVTAIFLEAAGGVRWNLGSVPLSAAGGGRAALLGILVLALRLGVFGRAHFAFLGRLRRWVEAVRSFLEPRVGVPGGFYIGLLLVSLWASLGPRAGLYTALYRLVPGFDFIRVPPRITILTVLALAVLAGMGAERVRRALPALLLLLLVELAAFPLDARPYFVRASPMDRALAEVDPGPVAAFPIPDPRDTIDAASRHSLYMLHATVHFLPLVNGYSGFTPERHDRLFRELASFPSENGLAELEKLSVRYAVFHRSGYDDAGWTALLERLDRFSDRLELRNTFDEGLLYEWISPGLPDRGSSEASRSRRSSAPMESAP
jgi:hypothetical protein